MHAHVQQSYLQHYTFWTFIPLKLVASNIYTDYFVFKHYCRHFNYIRNICCLLLVHTRIIWSFFFPGAFTSFYYKVRTIKNVQRFSFIIILFFFSGMMKKYYIGLSDMYSISVWKNALLLCSKTELHSPNFLTSTYARLWLPSHD